MAKPKTSKKIFPAKAVAPPKLSNKEWYFTSLLGIIFIAMAVLQLLSFNDFKDTLTLIGFSSPATWGAIIVLAELWSAAAFFKIQLSPAFRMVSGVLAVLTSGFWFYECIRVVSTGLSEVINMGFLGRFLAQTPGWWTIVESCVLFFWTLWAVARTQGKSTGL